MKHVLVFSAAFLGGLTASYLGVVAERGFVASIKGRSYCVCGQQIPAWWNVPVVSWLVLRGRAHCCESRIPARYVITEASMAVACAVAAAVFGLLAAVLCGVVSGVLVLRASQRLARPIS